MYIIPILFMFCGLSAMERPKGSFWDPASDSSASGSAASSQESSAHTTPDKKTVSPTVQRTVLMPRALFHSPTRRALEVLGLDTDQPHKRSKINSPREQIMPTLSDVEVAVKAEDLTHEIVSCDNIAEVARRTAALHEYCVNHSEYRPVILRSALKVMHNQLGVQDAHDVEQYNTLTGLPLLAALIEWRSKYAIACDLPVPLVYRAHIEDGDENGGYHVERDDKPVQRLVQNTQTGVFGGFFFQGNNQVKYSSFFKGDYADALRSIKAASQDIVFKSDATKKFGRSGSTLIEMYPEDSLTLRSAFAIPYFITWNELCSSENHTIMHAIGPQGALEKYPYTAQQLQNFAQQAAHTVKVSDNSDATYTIADIAPILIKVPEARGVYVQLPRQD